MEGELLELSALAEKLDALVRGEVAVVGCGAGRTICSGGCGNGELADVPMVGRGDGAKIGVHSLEIFEVDRLRKRLWLGRRWGRTMRCVCAYPPESRYGEKICFLV